MTLVRRVRGRRRRSTASRFAVAIALATSAAACSSDDEPRATDVTAAEAYIAIVRWEIDQHDPPADGGDADLPVIYLRSGSGDTVDIGVQADVVEATVDDVVVRFSDENDDSINDDVEGQPVKDDGVLFIVGDVPDGESTMDVMVRRYESIDRDRTLQMVIISSDDGAEVTEANG